jgi:hypothetical protein
VDTVWVTNLKFNRSVPNILPTTLSISARRRTVWNCSAVPVCRSISRRIRILICPSHRSVNWRRCKRFIRTRYRRSLNTNKRKARIRMWISCYNLARPFVNTLINTFMGRFKTRSKIFKPRRRSRNNRTLENLCRWLSNQATIECIQTSNKNTSSF